MDYSLCVAADIKGEKVNLSFTFDGPPSLRELLAKSAAAFAQVQPTSLPRRTKGFFEISTAVIYNDDADVWDRLEHSRQLVQNAQVYVFQPTVTDELQAEIPEPIDAAPFLQFYTSLGSSYRRGDESPRATASAYPARRSNTLYQSPLLRPPITSSISTPKASRAAPYTSEGNTHSRWTYNNKTIEEHNDGVTVRTTTEEVSHRYQRSPNRYGTHDHRSIGASPSNLDHSPMAKAPLSNTGMFFLDKHSHSMRDSPSPHNCREGSILKEARDQFESQMNMNLDTMRVSLKREAEDLKRSLSPS